MKRRAALLFVLSSMGCARPPQMQVGAPVDIDAGLLTTSYKQKGEEIDPASMVKEVKKDPAAAAHVKRAQVWGVSSIIVAGAGGGFVGWSLGSAMEGDPNWALVAIGGGLIVASVPLLALSNSQLRKGVERYNDGLQAEVTSAPPVSALRLVIAPASGGSTLGLSGEF